jgi:hypothetical protein
MSRLQMSDEFRQTVVARPLAYSLDEYWQSVAGEGPMGFQWYDKPHRIVYDLLGAVRYYSNADGDASASKDDQIRKLREALEAMHDAFQFTDESTGQYEAVQIARAALKETE